MPCWWPKSSVLRRHPAGILADRVSNSPPQPRSKHEGQGSKIVARLSQEAARYGGAGATQPEHAECLSCILLKAATSWSPMFEYCSSQKNMKKQITFQCHRGFPKKVTPQLLRKSVHGLQLATASNKSLLTICQWGIRFEVGCTPYEMDKALQPALVT